MDNRPHRAASRPLGPRTVSSEPQEDEEGLWVGWRVQHFVTRVPCEVRSGQMPPGLNTGDPLQCVPAHPAPARRHCGPPPAGPGGRQLALRGAGPWARPRPVAGSHGLELGPLSPHCSAAKAAQTSSVMPPLLRHQQVGRPGGRLAKGTRDATRCAFILFLPFSSSPALAPTVLRGHARRTVLPREGREGRGGVSVTHACAHHSLLVAGHVCPRRSARSGRGDQTHAAAPATCQDPP